MPSKKDNEMHFNIDTPALIKEIAGNPDLRFAQTPLRLLLGKLGQIALRATELNDPELNILMLEMKLYEVPHKDIYTQIENQKKRIKN